MRFRLITPAFVLGEYLRADAQTPLEKDFPSDVDLDHISPTWQPLDKEAEKALKDLQKLAHERQKEAGIENPTPKVLKFARKDGEFTPVVHDRGQGGPTVNPDPEAMSTLAKQEAKHTPAGVGHKHDDKK